MVFGRTWGQQEIKGIKNGQSLLSIVRRDEQEVLQQFETDPNLGRSDRRATGLSKPGRLLRNLKAGPSLRLRYGLRTHDELLAALLILIRSSPNPTHRYLAARKARPRLSLRYEPPMLLLFSRSIRW